MSDQPKWNALFLLPAGPLRKRQDALRASGMSYLEVLTETRVERAKAIRPADGIHEPVVYYMRMDGLVKIGTTTRIAQRTATIRPQGVLAVERGSFEAERRRHKQFIDHHSHGEWFWLTEELWQHISDLRSRPVTGFLEVDDWLEVWNR